MKQFTTRALPMLLATGLLIAGCASTYFKVTDPVTKNVYYTEEVKNPGGHATAFTDARSGAQVTIQNSEVKEISKQEYEAGLKAPTVIPPPAPSPAPASEAVPAPAPETAPAPESAPTPAPEAAPTPTP